MLSDKMALISRIWLFFDSSLNYWSVAMTPTSMYTEWLGTLLLAGTCTVGLMKHPF